MKSSTVLVLAITWTSAFSTHAAVTGESCFVAENPASISVSVIDSNSGEVLRSTNAAGASLKLHVEPEYGTMLSDMNVVTDDGLNVNVGAIRTSEDVQNAGFTTYYVECDGGRMDITDVNNGVVSMTTDGIRADIDGCDGTATVRSLGTLFRAVSCP